MLRHATIEDRILDTVRANPGCTLEEITRQFPDLHWSDVFIEVDRLRRLGRLRLTHNSLFTSSLRLP